jgi:hypothetical protein
MPSSFSPSLRIELIAPGEQAGTWGTTTNTNLGTLVEDAIAGFETVSVITANQALTYADGAADQARNAVLQLTTTTGAPFAVYAPPDPKQYTIKNASSFAATIYNSTADGNTTAAGTGVTVPAGRTMAVWSNGTNFAVQNDLLIGDVVGQLDGSITSATTAVTQATSDNSTKLATTAFVQAIKQSLHPVGSIYINATNNTNPATLLGFGTWSAFGAGRVPVGFNAADPLFDTAEDTGGSKDAIVVAHTHTGTTGLQSNDHVHGYSGTTGGQSANHVHSGTTSSNGAHAHNFVDELRPMALVSPSNTAGLGRQNYSIASTIGGPHTTTEGVHNHNFTTGGVSSDHAHSFSGNTGGISANHNHNFTTASAGSSGTNANLQPYITVYMWKRTA